MTWTAARGHEICPACGHVFTPDEPMALLTGKYLKRCAPCVPLSPVDWDAVHAEVEARRAQRTGDPSQAVSETFERVVPGSLNQALKDYGIKGVRRVKPQGPKPYADVAEDPSVIRSQESE